jgi:hypothetical protein
MEKTWKNILNQLTIGGSLAIREGAERLRNASVVKETGQPEMQREPSGGKRLCLLSGEVSIVKARLWSWPLHP